MMMIVSQVLHVVQRFSVHGDGISFQELKRQLDFVSLRDIRSNISASLCDHGNHHHFLPFSFCRSSLDFLLNEGHVFSTVDEHHYKSTERF